MTKTVSACKHEFGYPLPRDKGNFTVPATCMKCGYTPTNPPTETVEKWVDNSDKEEWGGWKFVSDMLDNPDEYGIYPTSKCYQRLYEFVVWQKKKAVQEAKAGLIQQIPTVAVRVSAGIMLSKKLDRIRIEKLITKELLAVLKEDK